MPQTALAFDADLLRRYDRPGPRYTSYPTAPQFHPGFGEADLRAAAARSNGDPIPRPLSLYVHVPFCHSPCFYCGCNRVITRDPARGEAYLARLRREIALTAPLFDRDRRALQLHIGGGTPNFLSATQLADLALLLQSRFHFGPVQDCDISIELDPRHCRPDDLPVLAEAGFNRVSLGVQDFDPLVQRAVNREQGIEDTAAIIEAARAAGMRSINVDLIYGLPGQSLEGFGRTLDIVAELRPDRLAVYSYAHLPHLFKAQRQIDERLLLDGEAKLALLQRAVERLTAAGYVYIGMDHFALPGDALARARARGDLHRNFMGYTTHADSDLVGLGVSAIGQIADTYSQNPRDLPAWEAAIDAGRLPVARGLVLEADDLLRADLIQGLMCHGEIDIPALEARHGIAFAEYFADDLARLYPLAEDGLVTIAPDAIRATARGQLLLRNIAMCFDRYLAPPADAADARPRFSRAI